MGFRDAAGRPQGFIVDTIHAAAARAGLTVEWRFVGDAVANNEALRRGEIDIIVGQSNAGRRREFFVTEPWWSSELVALVPLRSPIRRESDLNGRRLAIPGGAAADVAARYSGSIVNAESAAAAVDIACSGYADAAVIATMYLRQLLSATPPVCEGAGLRTIDAAAGLDYVLVARPDAANAARKLKDALDAITADGVLVTIAARHPPVSAPHAIHLADLLRSRYERQLWIIGMNGAGGLILIFVAFIVRQSRARRRLEESEARFRALFDAAPQSVLAIDRSGSVVFANRASRVMFGRDVVGTPAADLVPERFRAAFGQERGPAEIAALRDDGSEFPAEIRTSPVQTGEQLTLAFIADSSARVALQRQLLQSQKLESVGQLAGGVAHDFNNLLTVISGYASMSLDQIGPEHYLREPLVEIAQAADRAAALTSQLLAFSRRQAATPKLLSLPDLVRNLEKMLRRLIGEDIELTISADDGVAPILADPGQIEQVIVNLVVNARDAMPGGGRIAIRAGMSLSRVVLSVADTGTGMTPEVEARIFEPFFTTKEQGKGTGLGLSTVYGIVKQAGGEIAVETEIGRGTTFRIILPAAEGAPDAPAGAVARSAASGNETILVAEDEPGVRRFVKDVLSASGYTVLEAGNGREAVELAAGYGGRIHLLVTDLVMPEMGGIDLAERMKELGQRAAVLYMSGYSERQLASEAAGALIEKPFTPAALLERVREALKPPPAEPPPPNRP
jgi:two-component system cell cycle sensor histidine kinase/response regulator CckA